MPDFLLLAKALAVSALSAGATLIVVNGLARRGPRRQSIDSILSLAAGIYAGCAVLGQWPRWPPTEDRDRFLLVLLPLAVAVESVAVFWPEHKRTTLLRMVLIASAAPILLYRSTYLADLSGPHSAEWSPFEAATILSVLAAPLALVWASLAKLSARGADRDVRPLLIAVALATGIAVMLSGYYLGGTLALPLAGALSGALVAARLAHLPACVEASLGISLIAIYSLLVIGRFFGSLPMTMALALFLAPLVAWVAEARAIQRLPARARATLRLLPVLVVLIGLVSWAQIRFIKASSARSNSVPAVRSDR